MKEYWITNSRFKLIIVVLVLMWLIVIGFLVMKAEEVTQDPCRICAKKMGSEVRCTVMGMYLDPVIKTYYPNGTEKIN